MHELKDRNGNGNENVHGQRQDREPVPSVFNRKNDEETYTFWFNFLSFNLIESNWSDFIL